MDPGVSSAYRHTEPSKDPAAYVPDWSVQNARADIMPEASVSAPAAQSKEFRALTLLPALVAPSRGRFEPLGIVVSWSRQVHHFDRVLVSSIEPIEASESSLYGGEAIKPEPTLSRTG